MSTRPGSTFWRCWITSPAHSLIAVRLDELSIGALRAIASHSTLEELRINATLHDNGWLDGRIDFPVDAAHDVAQLSFSKPRPIGTIEEEGDVAIQPAPIHGGSSDEERAATLRMRAALTRTQPAQRSCEVRLALADWLHRRLRRGKLPTDENDDLQEPPRRPASLLRRCRRHVAVLRSTLQQQLSGLAAATVESLR